MSPLTACSDQKNGAQRDRYKPPQSKRTDLGVSQSPDGEVNRQAAREQAGGVKNRQFENVLRHWARHALADIKKVGDHENREDRSLGGNERKHSHTPA